MSPPTTIRVPPPSAEHRRTRWDQIPAANRQQLLCLLSRLLERQFGQRMALKEVSDDTDGD